MIQHKKLIITYYCLLFCSSFYWHYDKSKQLLVCQHSYRQFPFAMYPCLDNRLSLDIFRIHQKRLNLNPFILWFLLFYDVYPKKDISTEGHTQSKHLCVQEDLTRRVRKSSDTLCWWVTQITSIYSHFQNARMHLCLSPHAASSLTSLPPSAISWKHLPYRGMAVTNWH